MKHLPNNRNIYCFDYGFRHVSKAISFKGTTLSYRHFSRIAVYTTFCYALGVPLFIAAIVTLILHAMERVFFFSSHRRSRNLFSGTPWLPLRFATLPSDGEEVEFQSQGKITLRGTFLQHKSDTRKGTVLFCHEFNGNQTGISPYLYQLTGSGFDVLTFDFRNHGKSDPDYHAHPSPWMTTADMDDVEAAIDYLCSRSETKPQEINIFGLGKGANIALCVAGVDKRVCSLVLDALMPESRLFNRNCSDLLFKSLRKSTKLSRRRLSRFVLQFVSLLFQAIFYTVTCPFVSSVYAWRRLMLGFWYGCRFVNPAPLIKKVNQPMMIVHGHIDSMAHANQIQAFCDRMTVRPKLWLVSEKNRDRSGAISDDCSRQVARFFEESTIAANQ